VAASAVSRASRFDGERGAVAGELEQVALLLGELARREAPDVQHPDDAAAHDERDAEQGLDALLAQDRVVDVGVLEVGDGDRATLRGDATGEAAAERDPHPLLDLLLDALGGARVQLVALEQQDRDGVDGQDVRDALQQLVEQVLLGQEGERGVGDALQRVEHLPLPPAGQRRRLDRRLRHGRRC
jgi:hypothetical protein